MIKSLFRKSRIRGLLIGLGCVAVCWLLNQTTVFRTLENWSLDMCFVVRDSLVDVEPSDDVVIVALDDEWNDTFLNPKMFLSPELAKIIEYLQSQGASVIGVDLMIPDAVHNLPQLQPGMSGDATLMGAVVEKASRAEKEYRTKQASIAKQVSREQTPSQLPAEIFGVVVLPEVLSQQVDRSEYPIRDWLGPGFNEQVAINVEFNISPDEKSAFQTLALSDYAWREMGFVNITLDADNAVRRQELCLPIQLSETMHNEPSFAMAVVASKLNLDESFLENLSSENGDLVIPHVDRKMQINYSGASGGFQHFGFMEMSRAASGESDLGVSKDFWRRKIVLIGETYQSTPDRLATPFTNQSLARILFRADEPLTPGVEVHAHVIQTILDRKFITTPFWLSTPFLLLVWGSALGLVLMQVSLEKGFLIVFAHHWLWKVVCIAAFVWFDWRIEMVSVLTLGGLLFGVVFAFRWRWIRRMMGMVKSEAVAKALEADPTKLDLKGEERELTILFSDIRNFSAYSEAHTAREVVNLLNEYFAVIVPVIEKHGGIVNQYIGDGIMAIFGAPQNLPNHAIKAIDAAIEMITLVHQDREKWIKLDAPELRMGVGIHTGNCVVGTVGSPHRLDYTAIGDTTNTASRIEAENRKLGTEILASQATISRIPNDDTDLLAMVGQGITIKVKGKETEVVVHEIRLTDSSLT